MRLHLHNDESTVLLAGGLDGFVVARRLACGIGSLRGFAHGDSIVPWPAARRLRRARRSR